MACQILGLGIWAPKSPHCVPEMGVGKRRLMLVMFYKGGLAMSLTVKTVKAATLIVGGTTYQDSSRNCMRL